MKNKGQESRAPRLVMNGVELEPHEYETVLFLVALGKNIELIPQSHTPLVKSPDLYMDGLVWEMKSPVVNTRKSVEHMFYRAAGQASNVIFDLRRLKGNDDVAKNVIKACFDTTRKVRKLKIITKSADLEQFQKKK